MGAEQAALITVLLLRGAQTAGELRPRTERLQPFPDREAVDAVLRTMAAADRPLVRELERQAGQHDRRWMHLLGADGPRLPNLSRRSTGNRCWRAARRPATAGCRRVRPAG